MQLNKTYFYIIGSAIALTICGNSFAAADAKVYSGSNCVKHSGSSIYYHFNAVGNKNSSYTKVVCPAINDVTAKNIKSAYVRVRDRHPSKAVECRLTTVRNINSDFYGHFGPVKASGGSGSSWKTLNFGSQGSSSDSSYYISCTIPEKYNNKHSMVGTYRIVEY